MDAILTAVSEGKRQGWRVRDWVGHSEDWEVLANEICMV